MFLVLIILLFVLSSRRSSPPPKGSSACSIPKFHFLLILSGAICVYNQYLFQLDFYRHKVFQIVQGIGTGWDILNRLI